jgi:hypothetical protein
LLVLVVFGVYIIHVQAPEPSALTDAGVPAPAATSAMEPPAQASRRVHPSMGHHDVLSVPQLVPSGGDGWRQSSRTVRAVASPPLHASHWEGMHERGGAATASVRPGAVAVLSAAPSLRAASAFGERAGGGSPLRAARHEDSLQLAAALARSR